jgi:hypothetical protein
MSEANILEAIKQGQFTLSNGTFSLTSDGHVLCHGRPLRVQALWVLQARCYRLMRQAKQVYLRMRRKFLHARGKQSDYLMKQVEAFTPQDHHGEGGQPLLQGLIHLIHSLMLRGT